MPSCHQKNWRTYFTIIEQSPAKTICCLSRTSHFSRLHSLWEGMSLGFLIKLVQLLSQPGRKDFGFHLHGLPLMDLDYLRQPSPGVRLTCHDFRFRSWLEINRKSPKKGTRLSEWQFVIYGLKIEKKNSKMNKVKKYYTTWENVAADTNRDKRAYGSDAEILRNLTSESQWWMW